MRRLTLLLPLLMLGCTGIFGTSWQTAAGKFLTSTAITVDAAMQGWATATVSGLISADDQAQVKTLYVNYQGAMNVATNTYTLAVKVGDPTLWTGPSNTLWVSKSTLVTKTASRKP